MAAKKLSLSLALALAALSAPISSSAGDPWSDADVAREVAYGAVHLIDWSQTRYAARQGDAFRETNPVLGDHPSVGRVDGYFAATLAGHVLVTDLLPRSWRSLWQGSTIAVEATIAAHNRAIGVKIAF